jgi:DTW domain-containing protein YfiP
MRQTKLNRSRPASPSASKPSIIVKKPSASPRRSSDSKSHPAPSKTYKDPKPWGEKKSSINSYFAIKKPPAESRSHSESKPYESKKTLGGPKPRVDSKSFAVKKPVAHAFLGSKPFAPKNAVTGVKPAAPKKSHPIQKDSDVESDAGFQAKFDEAKQRSQKKPKTEKKPKPPKKLDPDKCSNCFKLHKLCICPEIRALETDLHVLILQHPQEPDENLGSARLAHLSLKNSTLKTGLSWANLTKALGRETQPAKWAVLHLGSGIKGTPTTSNLQFVSKQGEPVAPPKDLEGIVVLDGTWSQSKALWWRNPWLLKLKRSILIPQEKSLYRELRKEPRQECLSTIESIAETLDALGEPDDVKVQLTTVFKALLGKYREMKKAKA